MNLRETDRAFKLLRYVASGLVSEERFLKLVDDAKPYEPKKSLLHLSLADYQAFLNFAEGGDAQAVFFLMQKLDGIKKPKFALRKMSIENFTGWLKYIKVSQKRIDEHFKSIPKIPRSENVERAMKTIFNFGIYSIVDRMAVRHGITDEQAEQIPLITAITKLKIDADAELSKYNVEQALLAESRANFRKK